MLYGAAAIVVDRMDPVHEATVVPWSCPVPYFGRLSSARIATVGINPSNREFVDLAGSELLGVDQRLPTLKSLGLERWSHADSSHLRAILDSCDSYFLANPYDRWFKVLETVLSETGCSFYGHESNACHVDLVPYATWTKWGVLDSGSRRRLLDLSRGALGLFLRDSPIEVLILNGRSVVDSFQQIAGIELTSEVVPGWALERAGDRVVEGIAYTGAVEVVGGIDLHRPLKVLGYNHNLQSSYGITSELLARIRTWVASSWQVDAA